MVRTLGVAGLGLIGGSIALRAAACGWRVVGVEPDAEHARVALASGLVAELVPGLPSLTARVDALLLCAPVDALLGQLAELRALAAERVPGSPWPSFVADVASVKALVVAAAGDLPHFVPTHPLAGSERRGPAGADAAIFEGRTWTFGRTAEALAVESVRAFIVEMGGRPLEVDAGVHDRVVAATSHVPQALSVLLAQALEPLASEETALRLAGPGLRSMLRLARSDWQVWSSIFSANAENVERELRNVGTLCLAAADGLRSHSPGRLEEAFRAANRTVGALDRVDGRSGRNDSAGICVEPD